MVASVNKQILVGNLGANPEVRYFPDGKPVVNISVATTSTWRSKKTGEMESETTWHSVTFYGRLAEIARDFLKQGNQVYVEGETRTEKWKDKTTGDNRYRTVVKGNVLQILGGKRHEAEAEVPPESPAGYEPSPLPGYINGDDDDIPY